MGVWVAFGPGCSIARVLLEHCLANLGQALSLRPLKTLRYLSRPCPKWDASSTWTHLPIFDLLMPKHLAIVLIEQPARRIVKISLMMSSASMGLGSSSACDVPADSRSIMFLFLPSLDRGEGRRREGCLLRITFPFGQAKTPCCRAPSVNPVPVLRWWNDHFNPAALQGPPAHGAQLLR